MIHAALVYALLDDDRRDVINRERARRAAQLAAARARRAGSRRPRERS